MPSTGFLPGSSLFPAQEPALCTLQITPRGFPGGIWGDLAPKEIPKLVGGGSEGMDDSGCWRAASRVGRGATQDKTLQDKTLPFMPRQSTKLF